MIKDIDAFLKEIQDELNDIGDKRHRDATYPLEVFEKEMAFKIGMARQAIESRPDTGVECPKCKADMERQWVCENCGERAIDTGVVELSCEGCRYRPAMSEIFDCSSKCITCVRLPNLQKDRYEANKEG